MALLAGTNYDPTGGAAVSKSTAALTVLTAIDTTNLRLTFTVPANGSVLVRLRTMTHGGTAWPQILLGVLEGATVRGKQYPMGAEIAAAAATKPIGQEALYTITGLSPGASLTWDAAYLVAATVASSGIKYGGPNDTTTDNAFGGFTFEIWDAPNLLGSILYDPAVRVTKATTSLLAMTALDTTNLRIAFTVPASGKVLVRMRSTIAGTTLFPRVLFGALEGATVRGRQTPVGGAPDGVAGFNNQEAQFLVTGLTPAANLTWDAAYGVEVVGTGTTGVLYGGPNTTAGSQSGGFLYEIWTA